MLNKILLLLHTQFFHEITVALVKMDTHGDVIGCQLYWVTQCDDYEANFTSCKVRFKIEFSMQERQLRLLCLCVRRYTVCMRLWRNLTKKL